MTQPSSRAAPAPGRRILSACVLAAAALLGCTVPPGPSTAATGTGGGGDIGRVVQEAVDAGRLPGAVVLITQGGRVVYEDAFGYTDLESRRPQRVDDFFYLGSTSKPLAATALLTLVDDGRLSLDAPASRWFPALGEARLAGGGAVRSPTLREMLSHTSGMYGNAGATRTQQMLVWNFRSTLADTAGRIAREPFVYPPGEGFSYGGAAMTVAGRIAETVSEREFDRLVEERLLDPLGMSDTFYRTSGDFKERFSTLYRGGARGLNRTRFQPEARPGSFVLPPGGIISTARDLADFLQMHLSECRAGGRRILSTELCREMRRDQTGGRPMDFNLSRRGGDTAGIGGTEGYGLGWMLDELDGRGQARVFYHGGAFGTLIWADARADLALVLLTHVPLPEAAPVWDRVIALARARWGDASAGAGPARAVPVAASGPGGPRVVRLNPAGEKYVDPEILGAEHKITFQGAGGSIWLADLDPVTGTFASGDGRDLLVDRGAAPLRQTFNGPEFGVDASGWSLFYSKPYQSETQIWQARVERGRPRAEPVTSGAPHQSALVGQNRNAPSVRLIALRGNLEQGQLVWIDTARPGEEHPFGHWERLVNSPRWLTGTKKFVFSHREGPDRGQIALTDTETGRVTPLTGDAGDKTYPYAWHAPEYGGEVLLMALVDGRALGVWRDTGKSHWERLATLTPPPEARHRYLGSPEPLIAGGRSYASLVIKSEDVRSRGFEDAEIWIFGIDDRPGQRFSVRCDDGEYPLMRFDPETYVGRDEVFVYYNVRKGRDLDLYRCRTGIAP